MKKIAVGLFLVLALIGAFYAVIQSEIGRNWVRNQLEGALKQSGFEVHIGKVTGTLPHQIELQQVHIKGRGIDTTIAEITLRPVLWRLLKKEAAFTDVHAKGLPGNLQFDGKFRVDSTRALVRGQLDGWNVFAKFSFRDRLLELRTSHNELSVKANAFFNAHFDLVSAKIDFVSKWFSDTLYVSQEKGQYQIHGKQITAQLSWQDAALKAKIDGAIKGAIDLNVLPSGLLTGAAELQVGNLLPLNLYGAFKAKTQWHIVDGEQAVRLDVIGSDVYWGSLFAQHISFYSDLNQPFGTPSGLIDLEIEKGKWPTLQVEAASLQTTLGEGLRPFHLFAEGKWVHPVEIHMDGAWQSGFFADIQDAHGTFYNHPFTLQNPVHLVIDEHRFSMPNVEVAIAGGSAFVSIERNGDDTDAQVKFVQMPLDVLSLNPLDVTINGHLNLEAALQEKNNRLEGKLKGAIDDMEVGSLPLLASGKFTGEINRDALSVKGDLFVNQQPMFDLDVLIPIRLSIWPFSAELLTHKAAKGQIALHGKIEDLLDFFDLGPHRLEGQCNGFFRFTNTLARPLIEAKIQIENGTYDNYYTGAHLQNITADLFGEKNVLFLRTLTAQDGANGSLSASGEMLLLQTDLYPFQIDVSLQNLKFAEIDLVSASASGKVRIEGNALSALAKGTIEVTQTELTIPDHIPKPVPHLQVTYRNPIRPVDLPQTEYRPYPLFLDLNLATPDTISITGRGLHSQWKGNFHLGGTYTALAAKGKLELQQGEFNFSSRSFKLSDGALSFSGKEHEMPYINLAGSMETKGIIITARLKGPLDDPQITLQSNPPLPLGSIMSYLLFGQDVSDISGFEALQIATSLASLAGTGPDVMESTRRSLGVDRLRVISSPTEEGGETVALQVGKYVTEGVLVSFSQGTEESSTNISVEIELKHNFVFQIESDQHQEQGKFTLKWNLNY